MEQVYYGRNVAQFVRDCKRAAERIESRERQKIMRYLSIPLRPLHFFAPFAVKKFNRKGRKGVTFKCYPPTDDESARLPGTTRGKFQTAPHKTP